MNKFAKLTLQTARDTPKTAFAPSFDLLLVPSRSISFLSTRDCWVVSIPCKKQMRHSSEAVASQHFWPADWHRASSPKWLPDDAYRDSRPEDVVDTCHSLSDALSIPSLSTVTEFMGLMDAGRSTTGYSCSVQAEFSLQVALDRWFSTRVVYGPCNNRNDAHAGGSKCQSTRSFTLRHRRICTIPSRHVIETVQLHVILARRNVCQ